MTLAQAAFVTATLLFPFAGVAAAPPTSTDSISLQARLDGVGDGLVTLGVRFYDASEGGAQVGATVSVTAAVVDGIVSVPVSPVDPAIFNGSTRYMGISVNGGTELTPRTLVTSVPYALDARSLGGGSLTVGPTSNLGVGTLSPRSRLHFSERNGVHMLMQGGPATGTFGYGGFEHNDLLFGVYRETGGEAHGFLSLGYSTTGSPRRISIGRASSATFGAATFDPALTVVCNDEGRVGIGTRSPAAKLDVNGDARVRILTITGGSDIAEPAAVTPTAEVECVLPGMVMVIDPDHDGMLRPCVVTYDTAVAGVISGANGLSPGLVLRAEGNALADGEHPLAMTGRVWVLCDASQGAIRRGDRLTTSATPGHAMRAGDASQSDGAVIGKAMTELSEGTGLVLVLVNLQ